MSKRAKLDYRTLLERLEQRGQFRIKPGLERMQRVAGRLRNPQDAVPAIHIAGTNGKGSVAAGLEAVLRAAGKRTGLYTSPHLVDATERIRINGLPIRPEKFVSFSDSVLKAEQAAGCRLTYFEFMTAVAFVAFAREGVKVAVVECGLGGLWDATNVIKRPLAAVITSIGLDHEQWLGHTEAEIAFQKAGIIKANVPVISGVRGTGRVVIAQQARAKKASVSQLDMDFGAERLQTVWSERRQRIRYWSPAQEGEELTFGLVGPHQSDNAALVVRTFEVLSPRLKVPAAALRKGLQDFDWPGRFHLAIPPSGCPVLFDGAHNPAAMRRLIETLKESPYKNWPKTFVFGAFRDKDYRAMAQLIGPFAESVILTSVGGTRAAASADLKEAFDLKRSTVFETANPEEALRQALEQAPHHGIVVVTGSLALVGRLMRPWLERKRVSTLQSKDKSHA